jgi:hypothetical protein
MKVRYLAAFPAIGIFISAVCILGAQKPELHNPKFAKIIMSKDKSKVLPIILDTPSKDLVEYKILYTDKTCNGKLSDIFKPTCKTDYQYSIFSQAKFSPITMTPMYSELAKNSTKVHIVHYANQQRIADRINKKLRRNSKNRNFKPVKVPKESFYARIELEMYHESGPWRYDIQRSLKLSANPKMAPEITIDDKPTLELELVYESHRKSEVGVVVNLNYLGERDTPDENRYINNYVTWDHAGSQPKAKITVVAPDGEVLRTYKEDYNQLRRKTVELYDSRGRKKKKIKKTEKDTCLFYVYKSQRGGTVNVELDLGPLFGVLKASQPL